jgi:hypothetical protein
MSKYQELSPLNRPILLELLHLHLRQKTVMMLQMKTLLQLALIKRMNTMVTKPQINPRIMLNTMVANNPLLNSNKPITNGISNITVSNNSSNHMNLMISNRETVMANLLSLKQRTLMVNLSTEKRINLKRNLLLRPKG